MSKTTTNLIVSSLLVLTVLGLGIAVMPTKADAAPTWVPGRYNADGSYTYGDFYWPEKKKAAVTQTNTNTNSNTNSNNTNNSNSNYSNTQNTNGNGNGASNLDNSNGGQSVSSLASNAIFGANSFAPSGIIQWILFAIIILLLIIIVRKFFGGADRYHSKPLKYS